VRAFRPLATIRFLCRTLSELAPVRCGSTKGYWRTGALAHLSSCASAPLTQKHDWRTGAAA
jgi:hypothetical protein